MSLDRIPTPADHNRMRSLVTAVIAEDFEAQASVCAGLSASEERILRTGAYHLASVYTVFALQHDIAPAELWRMQMAVAANVGMQ